MTTTITSERPDSADARALIAELEGELAPFYPSESRHGYSVEKLLAQGVAFFLVLTVALSVLVLDLIYPLLDPRIRRQ